MLEGNMFPELFWDEYVAESRHSKEVLEYIKYFLDEHPEYHHVTGEQLQEKYNYFDNEDMFDFSWRAWGQLMASYMNSKEGKRKYHYMHYYM